ncbi:hypothetical protein MVES1_002193 [Malassezia vespertilionis]|uniref:Alkyl hydroperoxide reductase subunit C/ Thiol specific antioxidant domain-containing protein n=1 Tax=Malassezia vespertilionis TaxID=2020962 RepID=A0A2N1JBM5_9BASI|nr:uncharacterized protein MVES1_002193 [Malassezia vespertilionis]PKI83945.1 hypothetical protein MVES_002069 [Malassezia vespertilionis]WFD06839.1 hypothetical protein MVES1_002193 [Malassezia vespertilionis]
MNGHNVEKDMAVFHLPGHPLPALIGLCSTDSKNTPVDLFMLSLSRPVLLCAVSFPTKRVGQDTVVDLHDATAQPCGLQLQSIKDCMPALLACEPNLAVYGLSTHSPACSQRIHSALGLPFPLLADTDCSFSEQLELPRQNDNGHALLRRCTMLLREGQITRLDYPLVHPTQAGARAEEMLQRDAGKRI